MGRKKFFGPNAQRRQIEVHCHRLAPQRRRCARPIPDRAHPPPALGNRGMLAHRPGKPRARQRLRSYRRRADNCPLSRTCDREPQVHDSTFTDHSLREQIQTQSCGPNPDHVAIIKTHAGCLDAVAVDPSAILRIQILDEYVSTIRRDCGVTHRGTFIPHRDVRGWSTPAHHQPTIGRNEYFPTSLRAYRDAFRLVDNQIADSKLFCQIRADAGFVSTTSASLTARSLPHFSCSTEIVSFDVRYAVTALVMMPTPALSKTVAMSIVLERSSVVQSNQL